MAIRQRSPRVTFDSAAAMLDVFGLQQGGSQYRRLVNSFERIFGATIFFGTDCQRIPAKVVHRSRFNFMKKPASGIRGTAHRRRYPVTVRMSSFSATNSTRRSQAIRFRPICRQRKLFPPAPQRSTCSRGFPIGVSRLVVGSEFRCSVNLGSFASSAALTTPDLENSARSWKRGYSWCAPCGRNVQPLSIGTEPRC